jgi:hypothetical protein
MKIIIVILALLSVLMFGLWATLAGLAIGFFGYKVFYANRGSTHSKVGAY